MQITGTVVFEDLEGGFWGIAGDDGHKYYPVDGLPEAVQTKGLRIRAEVEPAMVMTTVMWGRTVQIVNIEPV